jgi:hypothetical protein
MATLARRFFFATRLGIVRLAYRRGPASVVAVGVAISAGTLVTVLAGSLAVQDRAVSQAIAMLAPPARTVEVTWVGSSGSRAQRWQVLDRRVNASMRRVSHRPPAAAMTYREMRLDGVLARLGAVDDAGSWLRLESGRLPRPCTPARCELLQLGSGGKQTPNLAPFRRVGRATLRPRSPLRHFLDARGSSSRSNVFVAEDVDGLSALPEFEGFFRAYSWIVPLSSHDLHSWEIDDFSSAVVQTRAQLQAASPLFDLTAPVERLAQVRRAGETSGERLLLVGGQCAVLVLAFALLAASRGRRAAEAAWQRLTWFGARPWQRFAAFAAETSAIVFAATAAGWVAGAIAAAGFAEWLGSPAGPILARSIVSARGLTLGASLALAATAILLAASRIRAVGFSSRGASVLNVVAIAAAAGVGLVLARGDADPESIAREDGIGVTLLLLPGLIVLAAAIVAARGLEPAMRLVEQLVRGRAFPLRLAALSLIRRPGASIVAVVFLIVSLGIALFAETYRGTLARNQADRAAFEVPLDFIVRDTGVANGRGRPLPTYVDGDGAAAVVRLSADVGTNGTSSATLLGVPPAVIPELTRWRRDFAKLPPDRLAAFISPRRPIGFQGPRIPSDAMELRLPVTVRGDSVALSAAVRTRDGTFRTIEVGETRTGRREILTAPVPGESRGGTLIGFEIAMPQILASSAAHREAEDKPVPVFARGTLEVERPVVRTTIGDQALASDYRNWTIGGETPGAGRPTATSARLGYLLTPHQRFPFRPRQPTDGEEIPVIASPRLADSAGFGGILPISVRGTSLNARVVATADLFPTAQRDFLIADVDWLGLALNVESPGVAVPNEVWLRGPAELMNAFRQPPLDHITFSSRRAIETRLRDDPLARGTLAILAGAALVTLALALVGLVLVLVSDLRDGADELFELETQGATPSVLRRHVRLRAGATAVAGLFGGLATGAILSLVVVDVVALSANATEPLPPLALEIDWGVLTLAVGAYAAVALAIAVGLTRRAFVGAVPSRGFDSAR